MGKEMVRYVTDKTGPNAKAPEDRQYLICLRDKSGDVESWEIVIGRKDAYEYIKEFIDDIDFDVSFILVEQTPLSNRKSIPAFMKYAGDFFDDEFDIDDYLLGDWDEEFYQKTNDIDPIFKTENKNRLSMEDMLNGGVRHSNL